MRFSIVLILIAICMVFGMVGLLEIGRRLGNRRLRLDPNGVRNGLGALDAAVFALLGLLIAFTFSGAAERFDARRHLIVEEVNAIGTAYLRLDLLPKDAQPALRESFRSYVDSRLAVYRQLPNVEAAFQELERSEALQKKIWSQAVAASRAENAAPAASILLLPALNQMIDITTTRTMAAQMHPPTVIFVLLAGLAFSCALLAGYGMAGSKMRSWIHAVSFAAIMAVTIFVILDIEYPRLGLIQIDSFDKAFVSLRENINY